ncbi:hypothetical protein [Mesorhizobium sp. M0701]|uniref:hypothetical protein n=1 Tax=Mesorhizobium sp. M0701 TaxID=2956989 RepID=UPI003335AE8B
MQTIRPGEANWMTAGRASSIPSARHRTFSDMVYAEIVLTSGARYQVKPEHRERAIYIVAGEVGMSASSVRFMRPN